MDRQLMQRSFLTIAATALLAACAHAGSSTLPAGNVPHGTDTAQKAPRSVAYPLRVAAGAVRRTHAAAGAGTCGTVVTQAFGVLTYAVRGASITHTTVDATGCDVGVFIGAGDGENDSGAMVDHVDVRNAAFAGVLVTDGANNVSIDHTTISATGGDPSGVSAALAIDGATHVRVAHTDVSAYQTYGFLAEAGASFAFDHVTATGPGAGTTGAQAGFAAAGAMQLGNSHPKSSGNQGTGATPAFLVPSGGGNAQSWAYFYCGVKDAAGNALTSVGDQPKSSNNSNDTMLSATCPGSPVPTPTPTPSPTPTPTPTPSPTPAAGSKLYVTNSQTHVVNVYDVSTFSGAQSFGPNGLVATISDPSMPVVGGMALAGGRLYVTVPSLYASPPTSVDVFDTATNGLVQTITGNLLYDSYGVAVGGGKMFVPDQVGNRMSVFDAVNAYAPLPVIYDASIDGPGAAVYGDGKVFVVNEHLAGNQPPIADDVSVFDAASGALVTTIADPAGNGGLRGAAFGNHLLFVANGNAIYVFDPSQGYALVRTITDPNFNGAVALAFGGNKLYAADSAYNQVTVFDAADNYAFVRNITSVMFPSALAAQ